MRVGERDRSSIIVTVQSGTVTVVPCTGCRCRSSVILAVHTAHLFGDPCTCRLIRSCPPSPFHPQSPAIHASPASNTMMKFDASATWYMFYIPGNCCRIYHSAERQDTPGALRHAMPVGTSSARPNQQRSALGGTARQDTKNKYRKTCPYVSLHTKDWVGSHIVAPFPHRKHASISKSQPNPTHKGSWRRRRRTGDSSHQSLPIVAVEETAKRARAGSSNTAREKGSSAGFVIYHLSPAGSVSFLKTTHPRTDPRTGPRTSTTCWTTPHTASSFFWVDSSLLLGRRPLVAADAKLYEAALNCAPPGNRG